MKFQSAVSLLLLCATAAAYAGPTGLNTIPTTDIVPQNSWIANLQNGNTGFTVPAFYSAPMLVKQTEFALNNRVEAGVDASYFARYNAESFQFNIKTTLQSEDEVRPNAAMGIMGIGNHLNPSYFLTLSKTLNYDQQQKERYRAHNRRNRKLLGRRVHAGVLLDFKGALTPFFGADLQMSDSAVFQTDWISGSGNALTAGVAFVMPDQKTVLNPALMFSNDKHRVDGFFLNISRQFSF